MPGFGAELLRLRLLAGLSLSELSGLVYYSKGHLSKVENGLKAPGTGLARACDAALDADGALIRLVPPQHRAMASIVDGDAADAGVWRLDLHPDGSSTAHVGDVRMRLPAPAAWGATAVSGAVFDALRRSGRDQSPSTVLPSLFGQLHLVRAAATSAGGADRTAHLALGARMTEFAGWMAQEAGDIDRARSFTDLAERLGAQAGLAQMEHHVLVRRALLAMYEGRAQETIDLAAQARANDGAPPRLRCLAALREAQGHALAGDQSRCLRTLDMARSYAARADQQEGTRLGPGTALDVHTALTEAWCLHDLGRHHAAIEILDRQVPQLTESARSYARFAARRVLAHAAAGNIDEVAALLPDVLQHAESADSETVRADLRELQRALRRWPRHPGLRALRPRLTAELSRPSWGLPD
jgi:transcriptional regulator with XRE-family HTH domain/tetratricopeptide (TPR) repeat protein